MVAGSGRLGAAFAVRATPRARPDGARERDGATGFEDGRRLGVRLPRAARGVRGTRR
ncbi:hypothetical protein [Halogeometricum luteum]|uniref:Uncharacterized protein n=1 Tax=Halogeometricum luteum TaxID=2950537 RepID=A0ABU2G1D2_9EURY|nr:hypothetical protein [Halogeometricum sp. S3BR5-2]MDS0294103.1 hypothetical protein [Halogeometricum sp. S3BR5-2]